VSDELGIILPPGVNRSAPAPERAIIDNRTGLSDELVAHAVETYWIENASVLGQQPSTFQTYANDGSLLARSKFQTPRDVIDEIKLARDLAERDDDVAAVMGAMIAVAFSDGMENFHEDEKTTRVFNEVCRNANMDRALKEMYREYLIAGQFTTVSLFTRELVNISDPGSANSRKVGIAAPMIGVLPSECIRPLGNDLFGDAELGYVPEDERLRRWLEEFFNDATTPARKAEMRREDPVTAAMFTGREKIDNDYDLFGPHTYVYKLNERMAHRTCMPKGAWPHPRPPLTRDFALLEAKRLLNIMDFALLQGGSNFIVVAKKGTDERPALPEEITNLTDVVRRASKSGVIVGDHRLSFEIITPDLGELLNPEKRKLIGRKLAMALLRLPEPGVDNAGQEGVRADVEILSRVITSDRHEIKRHVERYVYDETATRNPQQIKNGAPKLWFPKIILQGTQYFTDYVLKLRDRGDIPRKFAVEAAGFDWEAGVAQRKRENADNIDETMAPATVPFSSPDAGPQDNNEGRPAGSGPNNGAPNARPGTGRDNVRPLRTVNRNAGETVRAIFDPELGETVRVGEQTYAILEQYPERDIGRVTQLERDALDAGQPFTTGPLAIIPVNPGYEVGEVRALRLTTGLSMLVGERRGDSALVAKALCFRAPEFDPLDAEERALRWGFPIQGWAQLEEFARIEAPESKPLAPAPQIVLQTGKRTKKVVHRDENNNIVSIEEVPIDEEIE
jgi:hypothetical protein